MRRVFLRDLLAAIPRLTPGAFGVRPAAEVGPGSRPLFAPSDPVAARGWRRPAALRTQVVEPFNWRDAAVLAMALAAAAAPVWAGLLDPQIARQVAALHPDASEAPIRASRSVLVSPQDAPTVWRGATVVRAERRASPPWVIAAQAPDGPTPALRALTTPPVVIALSKPPLWSPYLERRLAEGRGYGTIAEPATAPPPERAAAATTPEPARAPAPAAAAEPREERQAAPRDIFGIDFSGGFVAPAQTEAPGGFELLAERDAAPARGADESGAAARADADPAQTRRRPTPPAPTPRPPLGSSVSPPGAAALAGAFAGFAEVIDIEPAQSDDVVVAAEAGAGEAAADQAAARAWAEVAERAGFVVQSAETTSETSVRAAAPDETAADETAAGDADAVTAAPGAEAAQAAPRVSILLTAVGVNPAATALAESILPPEIGFAVPPVTDAAPGVARAAAEAGRVVLLEMPLETSRFPARNAEPLTLLASLPGDAAAARLSDALAQTPGASGVVPYLGDAFFGAEGAAETFAEKLAERALFVVATRERADLAAAARAAGAPIVDGAIDLDHGAPGGDVLGALGRLEALARRQGAAVGVALAVPSTITALADWAQRLEARGVVLAPVAPIR